MYQSTIERIAEQAQTKAAYLERMPFGYLILSVLAGAYLAFGVTLIYCVGAPFAADGAAAQKLVMGCAFGVALTLVIFAGSELFTGNNMVCAIGAFNEAIPWRMVGRIWSVSLIGNLAGSLGLAWLVTQSGVLSQAPQSDLLFKAVAAKMSLSGWELFIRGILCNWLVCLAVWTASRTSSDTAKLLLIFWCLLAFIGSGFEHSIANQSLLAMALFLPHPDAITWNGFVWNQTWVIIGNIVGGSVFVGGLYWMAAEQRESVTDGSRDSVLVNRYAKETLVIGQPLQHDK
ncbi:MAG TPA: formate/nitrite transporter family protein [Nitrospiraceae bacterium]|nr:formate/nitrite transporter family protein [Nitrospiraceae bacterium]